MTDLESLLDSDDKARFTSPMKPTTVNEHLDRIARLEAGARAAAARASATAIWDRRSSHFHRECMWQLEAAALDARIALCDALAEAKAAAL